MNDIYNISLLGTFGPTRQPTSLLSGYTNAPTAFGPTAAAQSTWSPTEGQSPAAPSGAAVIAGSVAGACAGVAALAAILTLMVRRNSIHNEMSPNSVVTVAEIAPPGSETAMTDLSIPFAVPAVQSSHLNV